MSDGNERPVWDEASRAKYRENEARVRAVVENLRITWPPEALREVEQFLEHTELPLAISEACALARTHGYGDVRAEMLALADQFGEHDFTPEARHPYFPVTATEA